MFDEDGEFWMPFDDFIQNFNALTICRQMNTTVFSLLKTWHAAEFHGNWEGHLTGGCLNFKEQFLNNPQVKTAAACTDASLFNFVDYLAFKLQHWLSTFDQLE